MEWLKNAIDYGVIGLLGVLSVAAVTRLLRPHRRKCHTVTFDNGKEFAEHEAIAAELNADVYFAHPCHS